VGESDHFTAITEEYETDAADDERTDECGWREVEYSSILYSLGDEMKAGKITRRRYLLQNGSGHRLRE
jgi:hypothetical protein